MSQNTTNNGKHENNPLQGLLNSDENNSGNGSKTESDIPSESSMLSLSLRPRNNIDKDNNMPLVNTTNDRLPLQMTAIEPHFSRDLARPIKQEEIRPKTPPQPTPQPLQVDTLKIVLPIKQSLWLDLKRFALKLCPGC